MATVLVLWFISFPFRSYLATSSIQFCYKNFRHKDTLYRSVLESIALLMNIDAPVRTSTMKCYHSICCTEGRPLGFLEVHFSVNTMQNVLNLSHFRLQFVVQFNPE